MNNLLQSLLGGNMQVMDFVLNWLFNQPMTTSFAKTLNWDLSHMRQVLKGGIEYVSNSYKQRQPFAKTLEQRCADTTRIYNELQGFECLNETEKRYLSARMAGFNAKEIHDSLNVQESVEHVSDIINKAQEKYLQSAKLAGVGASKNDVEQTSKVNMTELFKRTSGS
jgi:Na+/phosphate symporter